MASSQKERILQMLRLQPTCGTSFLGYSIPRYAARIHELRNEGHQIVSRPCKLHRHETQQTVYELVEMSQMELGI